MNRYQNGKIYRLVSDADDLEYVGSTCTSLAKRLYGHKEGARQHPNRRVYEHFIEIGLDNMRIILIEDYPCASKNELERRERHHIEEREAELNMVIPARGPICEHGHKRTTCKPCGGSSICEHGINRGYCKPCGGSQICIHDRVRSTCKDCGGASICVHNRVISYCVPCGGGSVCEHGQRLARCKLCGGRATQKILCTCGIMTPRRNISRHRKSRKHINAMDEIKFNAIFDRVMANGLLN